jgi:hypothetical protein
MKYLGLRAPCPRGVSTKRTNTPTKSLELFRLDILTPKNPDSENPANFAKKDHLVF